jgi:outer membrane protein OmpA-like peptidoglycan-associated protein
MRSLIVLFLICAFFAPLATAQTPSKTRSPRPNVLQQALIGGVGYDQGMAMIPVEGNCFILGGSSASANGAGTGSHSPGKNDILVTKVSAEGVLIWSLPIGGKGVDDFNSMKATADGGVILIGTTQSNDGDVKGNHGLMDMFVAKVDRLGKLEWTKCYGGVGNDKGTAIEVLSDGTYFIGGESGSKTGDMTINKGGLDSWVAKIDEQGNITKSGVFGGFGNEHVTSVLELGPERLVVVNQTSSRDGDVKLALGEQDCWIFCLSKNFDLVWQNTIGGSNFDEPHTAIINEAGDIVICGTSFSGDGDMDLTKPSGMGDAWIACVSKTGNLGWSMLSGGAKQDGANGLSQTRDGGYVVVGTSNSKSLIVDTLRGWLYDGYVLRTDSLGNKIWQGCMGGELFEALYAVHPLPDGNYIGVGYSESIKADLANVPKLGGNDIWFVKFSDPLNPKVHPFTSPNYATGRVHDNVTGFPLNAEVIITDNSTLKTVVKGKADPRTGIYYLPLPEKGNYSINITCPGYMFYGQDLEYDSLGLNPQVRIDARLDPIKVGAKVALRNIYFEIGKWDLDPKSKPELNRLLYFLNMNPRITIEIGGHTDSTGDITTKIELSKKRTDQVRDNMLLSGVSGYRMETKGYGLTQPVSDNLTPEGRARNRRVEVKVLSLNN